MSGDMRELVRERYAETARQAARSEPGSCCGGACDPISSNLYSESETAELPDLALRASQGCGNPTALAELRAGEVVLDLGSGGGIDVILSARRVGPEGKAYGLDMTDEMLDVARKNQSEAGVTNVEFLKGHIEEIPLPDESVDVVISNCVINLSGDKDQVLAETYRVLRPGGRFAVSDVVVRGEVPAALKRNVELWVGCIAGALEENDYRAKLERAGFTGVSIEPTRVYDINDATDFLSKKGVDVLATVPEARGKFMSAFIRAAKPGRAPTVQVSSRSRNASTSENSSI